MRNNTLPETSMAKTVHPPGKKYTPKYGWNSISHSGTHWNKEQEQEEIETLNALGGSDDITESQTDIREWLQEPQTQEVLDWDQIDEQVQTRESTLEKSPGPAELGFATESDSNGDEPNAFYIASNRKQYHRIRSFDSDSDY